jgi:parallel beta-helix repeat protein
LGKHLLIEGEGKLGKRVPEVAVALFLICSLTLNINPLFCDADKANEANPRTPDYQTEASTLGGMTLAETIQLIMQGVDWNESVYTGMLFNEKNKTDLEALIDNYAATGDWQDVLKNTVLCRKLGIERTDAIKATLDHLPMIGPLPWTTYYGQTAYFCVEEKYALLGYYYAERYNYRLDRWNKTNAYNFFKNSIEKVGHPVLFIDATGNTWTIGYGPRYYDESASTVQCFLTFYELGIAEALNEALRWWKWINENLWYENTHYKYGLSFTNYECEAGFFARIASNLKYYKNDLENWSRVVADMTNRFLIDKWNSKQWLDGTNNQTTHVVVHHYPSNSERRLAGTISAWTALNSIYDQLENASQDTMQELLMGYDANDPCWKMLLNPAANLYDNSTRRFRATSLQQTSNGATISGLALLFLLGIVPKTTTLAFPLEEYTYEDIGNIDPELYNINLQNRKITVTIGKSGELSFIYGSTPVACNFPTSGIYEVAFSFDWNSVLSISKVGNLPSNRRFPREKEPRTWIVDDDGTADFSTIQQAVDAATNGDTIYVKNGTYYERVISNKTLSFIGENREYTIINGNKTGAVVDLRSDDITIKGFTIRNGGDAPSDSGIYLNGVKGIMIQSNNIADNHCGILLWRSANNSVLENNITNNDLGARLYESSNSTICHNNFVSNTAQVSSENSQNTWDNGYPSGGNYWSDYNGTDVSSGVYQNETGSDGIGDQPYILDEANADSYPLLASWMNIAVKQVSLARTMVAQGCSVQINATIENQGCDTAILDVIVSVDTTTILELPNVTLAGKDFTLYTFIWNTTGFAFGNHRISVYVAPIAGETDTRDNMFNAGWVSVGVSGDCNKDGVVDIFDCEVVAFAFSSTLGDPRYDSNADVNRDGIVDIFDLAVVALQFGQTLS